MERDWHELFKKISGENYEEDVEFLKSCGCLSEDWKQNLRHILHRSLNNKSEAYKSVQELLRMNFYIKQSKLVLSDITLLTMIPTNIKALTHLKCITLEELDIHTLPSDMSSLVNLTTLIVTKCPIYEIPSWIGELRSLNVLNFSRCRLNNVTERLVVCKNLDTLMLGYNFLRSLPDQVLEMPSINRLSLDSNPIQIEWKDTMLPSCKLLSIGDTKITNIPQGVANRLIQLVWCNVKDIQIPQNMKSIKYLDVRNNELDEKQIEKLKLFGNTVVL